uniref:AB hydrolase-1 domain-containing protein n=1 Tax=Pyrodinium bahamense TaxID=73915 RepID=A0A7S0B6P0_9DINO
MGSPFVVFLHGLESGPGGSKHRWLMEHYGEDVVCSDMQISLLNTQKANGLLRQFLANAFCTLPWNLVSWSVQRSLDGCLETAMEDLEFAHQRGGSVVVASSWGGAVATLALARGVWEGPAVLLAPAYGRIGRYIRGGPNGIGLAPEEAYAAIASRLAEGGPEAAARRRRQLLIVHGSGDDTVPIADSRAMAVATGIELREIEGADHRLNAALLQDEEPLLKTLINQVINGGIS